jgi:hypothetical protein
LYSLDFLNGLSSRVLMQVALCCPLLNTHSTTTAAPGKSTNSQYSDKTLKQALEIKVSSLIPKQKLFILFLIPGPKRKHTAFLEILGSN